MRCFQYYWRGDVMFKCVLPAGHTHAPFIAGLEARKTPLRMRRNQIVSIEHREIEELPRRLDANGMQTNVFRTSPTISIAKEAGHWIAAAALEFGSQNVCRHKAN
jgi:hypothetical protein